jgi:hypothetical protein
VFGAILFCALQGLHQAAARGADAAPEPLAELAKSLEIGLAGYLFAGVFLHGAYPRYLWLLVAIATSVRQVSLGAHKPVPPSLEAEPALGTGST